MEQRIGGEEVDKIINLKGIVISKFGSISAFSKEIGWCYSKTNRIVNGRQLPDASEIKDMARALNIDDPALVSSVFLS